jgi:hypothetical protein
MIPIPLRTDQQMKQFAPYTLSDEDKRLDAAEIYALYRTGDIRFLYPDSATKLITYFYKDIPSTTIFDKIAKDIHDRTKGPVYKIDVLPTHRNPYTRVHYLVYDDCHLHETKENREIYS